MPHDFSETDEGKHVVDADGRRIGSIERVVDGDAHFKPDPEMPGPLKSALGVQEGTTSTLQREHVDTVT
jgi:hypothetical protein